MISLHILARLVILSIICGNYPLNLFINDRLNSYKIFFYNFERKLNIILYQCLVFHNILCQIEYSFYKLDVGCNLSRINKFSE